MNTFLGKPSAQAEEWIKRHYVPTAPNGIVLYKTSIDGEWLQSNANVDNGKFTGFSQINSAVEIILPSKDANGNIITTIGEYALDSCRQLTSISILDSITTIGEAAFCNCDNLVDVEIGTGTTSITYNAFRNCSKLTTITIKQTVAQLNAMTPSNWFTKNQVCNIICTDGTVAVVGNQSGPI